MLRTSFRIAIAAGIFGVVVGIAWISFSEIGKSEAVDADASFALVSHQTGQMSDSLNSAGTFIGTEFSIGTEQIIDISTLLDKWSPKYQQAQTAYRKLEAAISTAEDSANAYFEVQRELTEEFHSEDLRERAQAEDDAEFMQYEWWRELASAIQMEALEIIHRLDDMDTTLQKLELRSDFTFVTEGFSEVPSEILALEKELAQFQTASDSIRDAIGSPFDVKG